MTIAIDSNRIDNEIRTLLADTLKLRTEVGSLAVTDDLYAAGLSSLATVDLMLALEDHFQIEFTSVWLNRRTFASIAALGIAVRALQEDAP